MSMDAMKITPVRNKRYLSVLEIRWKAEESGVLRQPQPWAGSALVRAWLQLESSAQLQAPKQ